MIMIIQTDENNNVFITIENSNGESEYFSFYENEVISCHSLNIDLNSAPTVTKIYNYITNKYGVEI